MAEVNPTQWVDDAAAQQASASNPSGLKMKKEITDKAPSPIVKEEVVEVPVEKETAPLVEQPADEAYHPEAVVDAHGNIVDQESYDYIKGQAESGNKEFANYLKQTNDLIKKRQTAYFLSRMTDRL